MLSRAPKAMTALMLSGLYLGNGVRNRGGSVEGVHAEITAKLFLKRCGFSHDPSRRGRMGMRCSLGIASC